MDPNVFGMIIRIGIQLKEFFRLKQLQRQLRNLANQRGPQRATQQIRQLNLTTQQANTTLQGLNASFANLATHGGLLFTVLNGVSGIFKKIWSAPDKFQKGPLFAFFRGLNTIAAMLRFIQLMLLGFIAGNLFRGFINMFVKLNREIQTAQLSLEAIMQAQKEMKYKAMYGIPAEANLPENLQKLSQLEAMREAADLSRYATSLAMRTGGEVQEMIQAARGIQVNTKDIVQTRRMLDTAVQLALLDPVQGMAGATFAIRELLQAQGARDFRSLATRFELSFSSEFKNKFTQSIKDGKIKEAIDMFKEALAAKGITDKILKNLERSWLMSMNVIRGQYDLLLARIGEPMFKRMNEYIANIAKFFIMSGRGLELSPQYRLITLNFGDILDSIFGKGFIKFAKGLRKIFGELALDYKLQEGIKNTINSFYRIFRILGKIILRMIIFPLNELGVLGKGKGWVLKTIVNVINFIVRKLIWLLAQFIESGYLELITRNLQIWMSYLKYLTSEEGMRGLIAWKKIQIFINTLFLQLGIMIRKIFIQLGIVFTLVGDLLNLVGSFLIDTVTFLSDLFGKGPYKRSEKAWESIAYKKRTGQYNALLTQLIPGLGFFYNQYPEYQKLNTLPLLRTIEPNQIRLSTEKQNEANAKMIKLLQYIHDSGVRSNELNERLVEYSQESSLPRGVRDRLLGNIYEGNIEEIENYGYPFLW